jgi:hypothetical protein
MGESEHTGKFSLLIRCIFPPFLCFSKKSFLVEIRAEASSTPGTAKLQKGFVFRVPFQKAIGL